MLKTAHSVFSIRYHDGSRAEYEYRILNTFLPMLSVWL